MYMYAVVVNKEFLTFIDVCVSLILHIIRHFSSRRTATTTVSLTSIN